MSNSVIIIDSDSDDEISNSSARKITRKKLAPLTSVIASIRKPQSPPVPTTSASLSQFQSGSNTKTCTITTKDIHLNNNNKNSAEELETIVVKKRKLSSESVATVVTTTSNGEKPRKRIKPIQISNTIDKDNWYQVESPIIALDDNDDPTVVSEFPKSPLLQPSSSGSSPKLPLGCTSAQNSPSTSEQTPSSSTTPASNVDNKPEEGQTLEKDENAVSIPFRLLLQTCREADPSEDMNALIKKKLLKYYFSVHPDFVISKGFSKTVKSVTEEIKTQPDLVYLKLKTIVEELKVRRANNVGGVMSNEDITTTGNKKRDAQVRRLNRELHKLTKYIAMLEQEECNLDEDISSYVRLERCKKRACEIYEKICDLTGESKHAHRSVKKPIKFNGTDYPQFNKTIQQFVNRTRVFPDFYDVLQCLDHCNKQYGFGLRNDEIRRIAQDAFEKIGRLLQNRRKSDLYETAVHFAGTNADPALDDPDLNAKLMENQKHHLKISMIIDKYAAQQDAKGSEEKNECDKEKSKVNNKNEMSSTEKESCKNHNENAVGTVIELTKNENNKQKPNGINTINDNKIMNIDGDNDANSNHSSSSLKSNLSNNNNNVLKNNISSRITITRKSVSSSTPPSPSISPSLSISSNKNLEKSSNLIKCPNSISIKHAISTSEEKIITKTTGKINNIVKNVKINPINSTIQSVDKHKIEEIVISDEDDS